jgi:hypothetical protein
MNKRFFKAQALAIVMVVLVIASIIGIALFSRISKSRQAAIDQQNSNAALEAADSLLDSFLGLDIELLESNLIAEPDQTITFDENEMGVLANYLSIPESMLPDPSTWCPGSTDNLSSILVRVERTGEDEFVDKQPGDVMAYNVQGASFTEDPCNLTLKINTVSDNSVFILKKVYEGDIDPDVRNYCVHTDGTTNCGDLGDNIEPESSISPPPSSVGNVYSLEAIDLNDLAKPLAEVRILPIVGKIGISHELNPPTCIDKEFKDIKITAEANCNGSFRAKQMILPGSGKLGYSTLFDYGIYDNGLFQP